MSSEVRWERMFRDELDTALANCPLVWLPYGLCEPHGPHNAVGLDALKAHGLACLAAKNIGGIVAPPEYWHIHEIGRMAASSGLKKIGEVGPTWLTAVPPWIFFRNVLYHIRATDALGFHAAILISGHGGCFIKDFKTLIQFWQPYFDMKLFCLLDHEVLSDGGDHAGRIETSQLWELEPACVDMSRLPKEWVSYPNNFATGLDAHLANRKDGHRMIEEQVGKLVEIAKGLLNSYQPPMENRKPKSFTEIDHLWQKTMTEIFPELEIMKQQIDGWPPPPADSRWMLNWKIQAPNY